MTEGRAPAQPRVFERAAAQDRETERVVAEFALRVAIEAVAIVKRRRVDENRRHAVGHAAAR